MDTSDDWLTVLRHYPLDCQSPNVQFLGNAGGFSGSRIWRVEAPRDSLCLRQWPPGRPTPQRLSFIHTLLAHAQRRGFDRLALPVATLSGETYVSRRTTSGGPRLWELSRWLPGTADFHPRREPEKLQAAMTELARFHLATADFSSGNTASLGVSPGIAERTGRLQSLLGGKIERLRQAVSFDLWPELCARGRIVLDWFAALAPGVYALLEEACRKEVPLQPVLRDIWHEHVLFQAGVVSGLVDYGAMRIDSVAADVARLLGSLAENDAAAWQRGLAAYEAIRPFYGAEPQLVRAFDQSTVLMAGISWLEWVYCERRQFENRAGVLDRMDAIVRRLEGKSSLRDSGL